MVSGRGRSGYLQAVAPAERKTSHSRTPAEDEFAQIAAVAARATFAVFHDDPASEFHRAAGMTPEETWRAVTEQVAVVAADAAVEAIRGCDAAPRDISRWHRLIFEPWFPEQAGRVRRGDEQGQYGVVWGSRQTPEFLTVVSCKGRNVQARLRRAFAGLRQAVVEREDAQREGRRRMLREATLPAAAFYAKLLSTHPFFDGNGRTAYVALQYALIRLGATGVALPDHDQQQWALGQGLRPGGRHHGYEALAEFFERTIRTSSLGTDRMGT
jgi:fido (protein-threonine AMPylation protein)